VLSGVQFDLLLPNNALAAPSNPSTACVIDSRLTGTHSLYGSLPPDHPVSGFTRFRVVIVDQSLTAATPSTNPVHTFTDGVVARCTFTILSNATPGGYPIDLERQRAGDERGTELHPAGYGNGIIVTDPNGCH